MAVFFFVLGIVLLALLCRGKLPSYWCKVELRLMTTYHKIVTSKKGENVLK